MTRSPATMDGSVPDTVLSTLPTASSSRMGDQQWGKYNCLPSDHRELIYEPAGFVVFPGMPVDFDEGATKEQIEKHYKLDEALKAILASPEASDLRKNIPFKDLSHTVPMYVHKSAHERCIPAHWGPWNIFEYPPGWNEKGAPEEDESNPYAFRRYVAECAKKVPDDAQAKALKIGFSGSEVGTGKYSWGVDLPNEETPGKFVACCFAGKLVAAAPLLASSLPTAVDTDIKMSHNLSKTRTITETNQTGLTVTAKVNASVGTGNGKEEKAYSIQPKGGGEVAATYSQSWTKTVTDNVTIQMGDETVKKLRPSGGETQRLDLRACAGLYAGWLIYFTRKGNADQDPVSDPNKKMKDAVFAAYPVFAPIHCAGQPSAAQEHVMRYKPGSKA